MKLSQTWVSKNVHRRGLVRVTLPRRHEVQPPLPVFRAVPRDKAPRPAARILDRPEAGGIGRIKPLSIGNHPKPPGECTARSCANVPTVAGQLPRSVCRKARPCPARPDARPVPASADPPAGTVQTPRAGGAHGRVLLRLPCRRHASAQAGRRLSVSTPLRPHKHSAQRALQAPTRIASMCWHW